MVFIRIVGNHHKRIEPARKTLKILPTAPGVEVFNLYCGNSTCSVENDDFHG